MGWLGDSPYNCPECDGGKEISCCECGAIVDCDYCDGTGWDPEQVDIPAFQAAEKAIYVKIREAGGWVLTHEGIDVETNTRWGRDGGKHGRVVVTDYLIASKEAK